VGSSALPGPSPRVKVASFERSFSEPLFRRSFFPDRS